jgi:Transcription factor WhiB
MTYNIRWAETATCLGEPSELFFEWYEQSPEAASYVDETYCMKCPVQRECLALGVARRETGVWGGIYLEDGEISDDSDKRSNHNAHKTEESWGNLWLRLTTQMT